MSLSHLLSNSGKPTDRATIWRDDQTYAKVCHQIAEEIYPQELRELYPKPSENREAVVNWFKRTAKLGEPTAKITTSTYTVLMEPNLDNREEKSKPKSQPAKPKQRVVGEAKRAAKAETLVSEEKALEVTLDKPVTISGHHKNPSIHIDLQIHISPEADANQIDAIFASMAKHLYR